MILVSRIITALILGIAGYQVGENSGLYERVPEWVQVAFEFGLLAALAALVGWVIGGVVGGMLQRLLPRVTKRTADRSGAELVVGAIALLIGLGISALLSLPIAQLQPVGPYLLLPMTLIVAYISAEVGSSRHHEILRLFGVHTPDASGARTKLLDTSALIDARIADIADAGFIEGALVVPVFVLEELQHIADSNDGQRRARGKRGLEVVTRLRKARLLTTTDEDLAPDAAVDAKLMRLAARRDWALVTTDFNLNRVASAQSIAVLNVNELANALKPDFVAGDTISLKVLREGKERGQGVGYLDDGTMVIVDGGRRRLGAVVDVEVTSVLQSPSGKLVFARLVVADVSDAGAASAAVEIGE